MVEGGGNAGEISGMWRLFLGREVGRRGTSLFATSGGQTTKTTKSNVISGGLRWAGENST
jgi:hypothetical protein